MFCHNLQARASGEGGIDLQVHVALAVGRGVQRALRRRQPAGSVDDELEQKVILALRGAESAELRCQLEECAAGRAIQDPAAFAAARIPPVEIPCDGHTIAGRKSEPVILFVEYERDQPVRKKVALQTSRLAPRRQTHILDRRVRNEFRLDLLFSGNAPPQRDGNLVAAVDRRVEYQV